MKLYYTIYFIHVVFRAVRDVLHVRINPFVVSLQNQEIEELTKICDELIAKMGKID